MKPESDIASRAGPFVGVMGNNFDFDNSRIVYPYINLKRRHIVGSSLICYLSRTDRSVNLNSGFVPQFFCFVIALHSGFVA